METLFQTCLWVGGVVLLIQILLVVVGGRGGREMEVFASEVEPSDTSHLDIGGVGAEAHAGLGKSDDAEAIEAQVASAVAGSQFKAVSFRTVVAFTAFFGLGGLWALRQGLAVIWVLLIALAAGVAGLYAASGVFFLAAKSAR